ncbi:MAG: ABC transporter permease [Gemmatimonadaceae bacterium]
MPWWIRGSARAPDVNTVAWVVAAALIAIGCAAAARWRGAAISHEGPWRTAVHRFRSHGPAMAAVYLLIALVVVTMLAPWLVSFEPNDTLIAPPEQPPSLAHPFGTDFAGRDVLSRVLYGGQISLPVAFLSVLLAATIGTGYGAVAGLARERVDAVMMRFIDAALAIPRLFLLIAVLAIWGNPSVPLLIVLLGTTGWFGVSRLVRAEVRALRSDEWMIAADALGATRIRLLWRHALPNVLSPVIVAATLGVGNIILLEAALGYLGIGIQPPTASWGNIVQDGAQAVFTVWWLFVFPGLAIVLTTMSFNIAGDALRDALDPREVGRR